MSRIVVDASSLLSSNDAAAPAHAETFDQLLAERGMLSPSLLAFEVGNVVHCKHPTNFGSDHEARKDILEAMLHAIELVTLDDHGMRTAGDIATRHRLSFYDASYLCVATLAEDRILLTQDDRLAKAARKELGIRRTMSLDDARVSLSRGEL